MKNILHIVASPRGESSRTIQLAQRLIERLKSQTEAEVDELNVFAEDLPELNVTRVGGKYMLMSGQKLDAQAEQSWQEIIAHIDRIKKADIVIVSSPMWNFSVPYRLKHYIDIIAQPGFTFKYGPNGPEGLLAGKKLFIVTTHGGDYSPESGADGFDKLRPYLKQIFAFMGISDQTLISAEPMDAGGETLREQALQKAKEQIGNLTI